MPDGVTVGTNQTYYIGWRFKLSSLEDNHALFQWKAYGDPMEQNYPIVLKVEDGHLSFEYYKPGKIEVELFDAPIDTNRWYTVAIRITTSTSESGGTIQFFWGSGGAENLKPGGSSYTGRTFDADTIHPKWGVYGETPGAVDYYVDDLKIGTTLADVFLG